MASQWYYSLEGQGQTQEGPIPTSELKLMAATGKLKPEDRVWKEGTPTWVSARQVKGLFDGLGSGESKVVAESEPSAGENEEVREATDRSWWQDPILRIALVVPALAFVLFSCYLGWDWNVKRYRHQILQLKQEADRLESNGRDKDAFLKFRELCDYVGNREPRDPETRDAVRAARRAKDRLFPHFKAELEKEESERRAQLAAAEEARKKQAEETRAQLAVVEEARKKQAEEMLKQATAALVTQHISKLKRGSISEQRESIQALGGFGTEAKAAVPRLTETLSIGELQRETIKTLGLIGRDAVSAVSALVLAAQDNHLLRSEVITSLEKINPMAANAYKQVVRLDRDIQVLRSEHELADVRIEGAQLRGMSPEEARELYGKRANIAIRISLASDKSVNILIPLLKGTYDSLPTERCAEKVTAAAVESRYGA